MPRPERMRQQFRQREGRANAFRSRDVDARIRVGEFANALTAAAAGRAERLAVADDEDVDDAPLAGERHRADRVRFRAGAFGVGGVLDVAAGDRSRRLACATPRRP